MPRIRELFSRPNSRHVTELRHDLEISQKLFANFSAVSRQTAWPAGISPHAGRLIAEMSNHHPDNSESRGTNPQSLGLADLAQILSNSGPKPVTVEMLEADIIAGAPRNGDGTMNLVHYAAWLARETKHGGD
jgi:hypothetical protein